MISEVRAEKRRSTIGSGAFMVTRTVRSSTLTTSLRLPRNSQATARPGAFSPEKRSGPNVKTTSSATKEVVIGREWRAVVEPDAGAQLELYRVG